MLKTFSFMKIMLNERGHFSYLFFDVGLLSIFGLNKNTNFLPS